MFKIHSPRYVDIDFLEKLDIHGTRKILYLLQGLIPINIRTEKSLYIASEGKNILGYIFLNLLSKKNNSWQIENVFVAEEDREKGIGEELLRYVLSLFGSYGVEHFLSEIDCENFSALSLFHQCGFRRYAKANLFEKEFSDLSELESISLEKDFFLRKQSIKDLNELEKIGLSIVPPDLRAALGREKDYYFLKKGIVLVDKKRELIIGWADIKEENEVSTIEILISPGWTYLYEPFLNEIIKNNKNKKIYVKAISYNTELSELLNKKGFLPREVKELLVRSIWLRSKEKSKQITNLKPFISPT